MLWLCNLCLALGIHATQAPQPPAAAAALKATIRMSVVKVDTPAVTTEKTPPFGNFGPLLQQLLTPEGPVDIQYTIEGEEEIGWMPLTSCSRPIGSFDSAKDIIFYDDRPATWLSVPAGHFAIFFPEDAHAPLAGRGLLKKAIVKIAV